ncbi:odorant receptor 23a isoform X2 [Halyomorpha halys]|uniref:odorant receptor 23a isoform X2 n=1 Tax=Halyomorpha halys TaxID=286706 RepID=UPI0006D5067A
MLGIKLASYETDPAKLTVFRNCLIYAGALNDGTLKSKFFIFYRAYGLIVGFLQYAIMATKTTEFMTVVEVFHWMCDFTIMTSMTMSCLYYNPILIRMEARIKAGFFDYGGPLTPEQIKVRATMNRNSQLMSKLYCSLCYCGLVATYIHVFFAKKEYLLPYPMWFPHEIRNMYQYVLTLIHVFIVAETMTICAFSQLSAFVALSSHLIAQYKILIIAIKEIDLIAGTKATPEEKILKMHAKLKTCVKHHVIINKYFDDLHKLFSIPLLTTAIFICLAICTLGFILLSPNVSVPVIGALIILFLPEMFIIVVYCVYGQKVADVCEEFGHTIYYSDWYTKPLSVQRDFLMILIGSRKKRQLTGFGLHEFSMKGLSESLCFR